MIIKGCIICGKKHSGKGFCLTHYARWKAGRPLDPPICKVPYCGSRVNKYVAEQLCSVHYHEILRKGKEKRFYKNDGGKWGYKDYRRIQNFKKGRCDMCGITSQLWNKIKFEIHHKDENKRNSNSDNLMTVCTKCHKVIHRKKKIINSGGNYGVFR